MKSFTVIVGAILTACLFALTAVGSHMARADSWGPTPALRPPKGSPSRAFVAQRLDYVVYVPNFSPSHPLSQTELMKLILYHGGLGDFPKNLIQTKPYDAPPGKFDNYITRSTARRFVRILLGKDLKLWHALENSENPTIIGDDLGWWYNSGNSMSEAPFVRVTRLNSINGQSVLASFHVFHRLGNLSESPPLLQIGVGSATLRRNGSDWIITSWHVDKNSHWH